MKSTYVLKHGGVEPTIAAWEAAMPRRSDYSPLLAAFHSLDGPPRITHIWPYADLAQRAQEPISRGGRMATQRRA
jgi:hypothetical protein